MIFNDESWDVVFARPKTASKSRLSIDCAYDNMQDRPGSSTYGEYGRRSTAENTANPYRLVASNSSLAIRAASASRFS